MTGWPGIDSLKSCCCCELCQPVRCIIDQHEVEIIPATHRSSASSLAPTTRRSLCSTSSNTLPSSCTIISEDSVSRAHSCQVRPQEPAAWCAATAGPSVLSQDRRLHSSHGYRPSVNKIKSQDDHVRVTAANVATLHRERRQQPPASVGGRSAGPARPRHHRPSAVRVKSGKKKPSPALRSNDVEQRMDATSNSSTFPISSKQRPFQLFEQDPQHGASFPGDTCTPQAKHLEPLAFDYDKCALHSARRRKKILEESVNNVPIAKQTLLGLRYSVSESNCDVPCASACETQERDKATEKYDGTAADDTVGNFARRAQPHKEVARLDLRKQRTCERRFPSAAGQQSCRMVDSPVRAALVTTCAVLKSFSLLETCTGKLVAPVREKKGAVTCSTDSSIRTRSHWSVAAGNSPHGQGSNPQASNKEDGPEDAAALMPESLTALRNERAPGRAPHHRTKESLSGPWTEFSAAFDGERDKSTCNRASQLPSVSLTGAIQHSKAGLVRTPTKSDECFCSKWSKCSKAPGIAEAGSLREDSSFLPTCRNAAGVFAFIRSAVATPSASTCMATCAVRSRTAQKEKDRFVVPPRKCRSWDTSSFLYRDISFDDPSIVYADSLASAAVTYRNHRDYSAVEAESVATAARPAAAFQTDTRGASSPRSRGNQSLFAGEWQKTPHHAITRVWLRRTGVKDLTGKSTAGTNKKDRPVQSGLISEVFLNRRQASVKTLQQGEQDLKRVRIPADADAPVDVTWHVHQQGSSSNDPQRTLQQGNRKAQPQSQQDEYEADHGPTQERHGDRIRRRNRLTAGKLPSVFPWIIEKSHEEETGHKQSFWKKQLLISSEHKDSNAADISFLQDKFRVILSRSKRGKQISQSLPQVQAQQQDRHELRGGGIQRKKRKSLITTYTCSSATRDLCHLRCHQQAYKKERTASAESEKYRLVESSRESVTSDYSRLSSCCDVSIKKEAARLRPNIVASNEKNCFLGPFAAFSTINAAGAATLHNTSPPQQPVQPASVEQFHSGEPQYQKRPVDFSREELDGCILCAQVGDATTFDVWQEKNDESVETRFLFVHPSNLSALASSYGTCKHLKQRFSHPAYSHCREYIESKFTRSKYSHRGSHDTFNTRKYSSSSSVPCGRVGTGLKSESACTGQCTVKQNALLKANDTDTWRSCDRRRKSSSIANRQQGDSDYGFPAWRGRKNRTVEGCNSSVSCKAAEAHSIPTGNTAQLRAQRSVGDPAPCPSVRDNVLRSHYGLPTASDRSSGRSFSKQLSGPRLLISCSNVPLSTASRFSRGRLSTVGTAMTSGCSTSWNAADTRIRLERSCVCSVDRSAVFLQAQPPLRMQGRKERQFRVDNSFCGGKERRALVSTITHSSKERCRGLLSQEARLVLWQTNTKIPSTTQPAQVLEAKHETRCQNRRETKKARA